MIVISSVPIGVEIVRIDHTHHRLAKNGHLPSGRDYVFGLASLPSLSFSPHGHSTTLPREKARS